MKYVIGVDIGGSKIKAALIKGNNAVKKHYIRTEASKGSKTVFSNIIKAIEKVWDCGAEGIGVGCAGLIDSLRGVVVYSPNLPFRNFQLAKKIRQKFKVHVAVENDANCFALAEAKFGTARAHDNVIGLTLGTGVGAGIVINGAIYDGKGHAGEIGHTTICFDGLRCSCGNYGCVEAYIGGRSVMRRNGKGLREFYELASKGNNSGLKFFREYGKYLGIMIANTINSFDPDVIVIGGKASKAWKFFYKEMKKEAARALSRCPIVKSKMADASVIGAALLLKE